MPFKKGNTIGKGQGGRKNPPGGRPTRAAMIAKKAQLEIQEKELAIRIN